MADGAWRTLADITAETGVPEASASARLRDLRNKCGLAVDREHVEGGLHRYRVRAPGVVPEEDGPKNPPPTATQRGCAMSLTALSIDVLTDHPQRLLWCVDLINEAPKAAEHDDPTDPDNPDVEWADMLARLKGALERQPHRGQRCGLAMVVNVKTRATGRAIQTVIAIPYTVDLTIMGGREPPMGVWRLWPEPPDDAPEGDRHANMWWYEGIPF